MPTVITQRVCCRHARTSTVLTHVGATQCHKRSAGKYSRPQLAARATVEQDTTSTEASRAEARRMRRETRDATDTTVDINPADVEMVTDNTALQSAASPEQTAAQQQAKELLRRKSALIMKLTSAGADLEQMIKDNQHENDEVLLKMLEKRAEAAYNMGEEEEAAFEGLMLLWRRLNAELQRMQASPAARLLDTVLQVMDPASGLTLQDRQQAVQVLLRKAFHAPGSRPVDIFGMAAALAEGQAVAAEELVDKFVPRDQFVQEAEELLAGAIEVQQGLEKDAQSGQVQGHQQEVDQLLKDRRMAIVQLQEIIALAKTMRLT
ncbi:hypothetical protein WJX79_006201 [Trebouxia sp. C0005]